jgi:hypothetical protein
MHIDPKGLFSWIYVRMRILQHTGHQKTNALYVSGAILRELPSDSLRS